MNIQIQRLGTTVQSAVIIVLLLMSPVLFAQGDRFGNSHDFDIIAQPLDAALIDFAEQADLQLLVQTRLVAGHYSLGITGAFGSTDALNTLLASSGLTYQTLGENTVAVSRRQRDAEDAGDRPVPQQILMAQNEASNSETPDDELKTDENRDVDQRNEVPVPEVIVTGTRLKGVDAAAPSIVIDRQAIELGGFASAVDVFRSLPQNFGSANNIAGNRGLGDNLGAGAQNSTRGWGGNGVNLRGLGASATLVLINGRRLSGAANAQSSFTDISAIPADQIERIEILTDGASAIYGSDAVAGVINIILRNDYEGIDLSARYEFPENGGETWRISGGGTFGWGNGRATISASFEDTGSLRLGDVYPNIDPSAISDWRIFGGSNHQFGVQPGVIYEAVPGRRVRAGDPLFFIPAGQDGTNLTEADLIPVAPGTVLAGTPPGTGEIVGAAEDSVVRIDVTQDLGAHELRFDALWSNSQIIRQPDIATWGWGETVVAPENLYSPFNVNSANPMTVVVGYYPHLELANDVFGTETNDLDRIHGGLSIGGPLPFGSNWNYDVGFGVSKEDAQTGDQYSRDQRAVTFEASILGIDAVTGDPLSAGQLFTVFGDGSANTAQLLQSIMGPKEARWTAASTKTRMASGFVTGDLFSVPAGENVSVVFGGEIRDETYEIGVLEGQTSTLFTNDSLREYSALFAEVAVPIIGADNRITGIDSLLLTAAVRNENVTASGSTFERTIDFATFTFGPLEPVPVNAKYNSSDVQFGLVWYPVEDLKIRSTWGTSFVAPSFSAQFTGRTIILNSPFDLRLNLPAGFVNTKGTTGGNPDLIAQEAENYTVGFDWIPQGVAAGLSLGATYTSSTFENFIGRPDSLFTVQQLIDDPDLIPGSIGFDDATDTVIINKVQINFADRWVKAIDLNMNYETDSAFGYWSFGLGAVRQLELSTRPTVESEVIERLGTDLSPTKWQGRGDINWSSGPWNIASAVNYKDGYDMVDTDFTVSSYTTVDLQVRYQFERGPNLLEGMVVSLGARDLFDASIPFHDNVAGFNPNIVDPRGRTFYLEIRKNLSN